MKKMFASIASVLMCAAMFATAAFADSAPATVDYSDIAIGCVQTTDENGNKQENTSLWPMRSISTLLVNPFLLMRL